MQYRAEIDGLRAIAVLPVVLFHAGLPGFHGGYVGVDVFFVISGYLITEILLRQLEVGQYSLTSFYERRARRILPALFLVVATCIPFSLWLMTPEQLISFGKSIFATALFISNFHFRKETDYFAGPSELQPLVHTWSLAIEEQFYLLFPPLLAIAWRRAIFAPILFILPLASLWFATVQNDRAPDFAFFLLPSRVWELALGSWLAWSESRRGPTRSNGLVAVIGLVLLAISIFTFESDTPHPGIATLLPTMGAVLVLAFGRGPGFAHRFLSNRILVSIGLISYSLYLWHQPILAFARLLTLNAPSPIAMIAFIGFAFVISGVAWRFVETPFRDRARISNRTIWTGASAGIAVLVCFGFLGWSTSGLPQRFDADLLKPIEVARPHANMVFMKDGRLCADRDPEDACILGTMGPPTWALVGDSTAGSLSMALDEWLTKRGESGVQLTRTGCIYLPGFRRRDDRNCPEMSFAVQARLRDPRISRVIVAGRYTFMLTSKRFDNGEGGRELGPPRSVIPIGKQPATDEELEAVVLAGYQNSIRDLIAAGKVVYLIYPIPEVGWNVPDQLFKLRLLRNLADPLTTSSRLYRDRTARVVAAFDALGESPNLVRLHPDRWLCGTPSPERCVTELEDEIQYADDNHLSLAGAQRAIRELFSIVDEIKAETDLPQVSPVATGI